MSLVARRNHAVANGPGLRREPVYVKEPYLTHCALRIAARTTVIMNAVTLSEQMQPDVIDQVANLFVSWIRNGDPVRVVGAGRALLAGSIAANRLAHAGANVHHIHELTPLPSTARGGAILSCSASGRTADVLALMKKARRLNPDITIVGIADHRAHRFRQLCDHFLGVYIDPRIVSPLTALGDIGEYTLSLLLDAIVLIAAERIGFSDSDWRIGHEDLGPTGPYGPMNAKL